MKKRGIIFKARSWAAAALRNPLFNQRKINNKRGRAAYTRKKKHKQKD